MGNGLSEAPLRRVVLTGFMGAGKSTVGPILAARLGWRFIDLDHLIAERAGRSIREIFEDEGEAAFRQLEADLSAEVLAGDEVVIASGGGWAANSLRDERLPPGTLIVWLRVSAEEALRRTGGAGDRPLLDASDPLAAAQALLVKREAAYNEADLAISSEGRSATEIAVEIEMNLRGRTGPVSQSRASGAHAEQ